LQEIPTARDAGDHPHTKGVADSTISTAPGSLGRETVLVVDDDDGLRELTRTLLLESGYTVMQAASADEALGISRRHKGRIDLLLTDVIMAGMDGPELADRFTDLRSETRVLFMSGYTAEALSPSGVRAATVRLLAKPFSSDELTCRVREAIDGDPIDPQGH
jgi:two-component system cell cycle sensor histidine kinase/response regulator CckA